MTSVAIADELEVTVRTVYRDVATLQARRIPIERAAGVGYVLRRGYELPPLMFTEDEAEAVAVGVRLLARTGDPLHRRGSRGGSMQIAYQDGDGRSTERVIQPFAVAYYVGATLICAWCELRNDVRHFRTNRVVSADVLDESFSIIETVIARWLAERQDDQPSATPVTRRRPRRQFGRHHSPYHVARSGLPWCHIDKLRMVYYSGSLQYPSRGHETRIGGDAFAFARDGEDQTAYWEEQMPWQL